jgi:hypothetical protein
MGDAMSDNNNGTTESAEKAPETGTPKEDAEVTLLKSRNSGLDAKVTSLTAALAEKEALASAAQAKLSAYEKQTVGADEALRAQLAEAQEKANAAEQKAAVALISAKFPESFAELGDAVFGMSESKLASLEARLTGAADSGEAPTPRGTNGPRTAGTAGTAKPETIADVKARLNRELAAAFGPRS